MGLRNWLKGQTRNGSGDSRGRRKWHARLLAEEFEARALPSVTPSYTELTGASNPFNGFDVGTYSTPKFVDLDGDGDLDLAVAANDNQLRYFKNTGTASSPTFVQQTGAANPFNGLSFGTYCTPAFGDLDGDGDFDLVAGDQPGTFRYFRNTGTATSPTFVAQTGTNNPFNGFDVGNFSTPELGDVDGDGDLDLVSGDTVGQFHYFKNTGTTTSPTFAAQTGAANPFNGFSVGLAGSVPAFGDVDDDGDLDLVSGGDNGTQFYFENTGPTGSPVFVARTGTSNPFNGLDVGTFSAPTLGNLDGDNDLDLVSGNNAGTLKYYRAGPGLATSTTSLNLGTTTAGTAGTPQTFTVSGIGLVGDITVTAPTGVELSDDGGSSWQTVVTVTPSGGKVAETTLSARITAGASEGAVSGNITVTSTSATTRNVAVSGTVDPADSTPPAVQSIDRTSPAGPTTNATSVTYTVTFSEAVTGVDATDFALALNGVTAATPVAVSGSGTTYTVTVSGVSGTGTLGLNLVGDGTITDAAGNPLTSAGNFTGQEYTIDQTAPTATITSSAAAATNTSPIPVTVTFSESVTGFTEADVAVGNGTVINFAGSGDTYTFDVVPDGDGPVTVDVGAGAGQDAAGNGNAAATQLTRTYDSVGPTAAVTSTAPAATGMSPIRVTVTFSEPVTGFTAGSAVVANGAVSNFTGSGATYTFDVTPTAPGVVTVDVPAAAGRDAGGNDSTAAASRLVRTFDPVRPGGHHRSPVGAPGGGRLGCTVVSYLVAYADPNLVTADHLNGAGRGAGADRDGERAGHRDPGERDHVPGDRVAGHRQREPWAPAIRDRDRGRMGPGTSRRRPARACSSRWFRPRSGGSPSPGAGCDGLADPDRPIGPRREPRPSTLPRPSWCGGPVARQCDENEDAISGVAGGQGGHPGAARREDLHVRQAVGEERVEGRTECGVLHATAAADDEQTEPHAARMCGERYPGRCRLGARRGGPVARPAGVASLSRDKDATPAGPTQSVTPNAGRDCRATRMNPARRISGFPATAQARPPRAELAAPVVCSRASIRPAEAN
jgi:uncharacterized protein (DUF2141 family)